MWTIVLGAALAAPPGYRETKTTEHCALFLGPADAAGRVPMRAECAWPSVDPQKLIAMFSKLEDHDLFFSTIVSSDLVRSEGGASWVRQVHRSKGIADRECVLKMTSAPLSGGTKFAWTLDNGDLVAGEGRVLVGFDDGYWEFTADPAGGTRAVHELVYDPGGSVPGFLVRWFQTSGLEAIVNELRTYAETH